MLLTQPVEFYLLWPSKYFLCAFIHWCNKQTNERGKNPPRQKNWKQRKMVAMVDGMAQNGVGGKLIVAYCQLAICLHEL